VTNRGGRLPKAGDTTAPSSGTQVVTDAVTGSSVSGTVSIVDAETFSAHEMEVGLQPSDVVPAPDGKTLLVANSHSDPVSVIDTSSNARSDVKIPTYPDATLGSQPIAATFAADGKTVYIACGGNNAIAVMTQAGRSWKVTGAVPTGWFPTAIAVARDGSL